MVSRDARGLAVADGFVHQRNDLLPVEAFLPDEPHIAGNQGRIVGDIPLHEPALHLADMPVVHGHPLFEGLQPAVGNLRMLDQRCDALRQGIEATIGCLRVLGKALREGEELLC